MAFALCAVADLAAQGAVDPVEFGPHAVGFRSSIELDHGRSFRTAWDDGATYGAAKSPRPVLVNLWYPAQPDDARAPMPYGAYFELAAPDPTLAAWADALSAYAADVACTELLDAPVAELDEVEAELWRAFLASPTRAQRDAAPLEGRFPLVVYHSGAGSSYEDNSGFAEYLASHGYVVVSSAYPRADGSGWGIDAKQGSVRDMEFLARHAAALEFVDWNRCAFGGHSAGAQVCLSARLRPDCPADALFLLDTTLDYYTPSVPTFQYVTEPLLSESERVTGPLLAAAGPEAAFQLLDALDAADRSYVTLPELGHNEFIQQGVARLMVRAQLAALRDDDALDASAARLPEVRRLHTQLARVTREFLDAALRDDTTAFEATRAAWTAHAPGGREPGAAHAPVGTRGPEPWQPGAARAPTPRQVPRLVAEHGVDALLEALDAHADDEPRSPLYGATMLMSSVLHDLAREARLDDARRLHAGLARHDLDGVSALRFLALMSTLTQRPERARDYLELALSIAPDDEQARASLAELPPSQPDAKR